MSAVVPGDRRFAGGFPQESRACRGNDLVDFAGDEQHALAGQATRVVQRVERVGQFLEVGLGAAGFDPDLPERGAFGHFPEDGREIAAGEQEGAFLDRGVDGGRECRDDSAQADSRNAKPAASTFGWAASQQPARRTSSTAWRIAVIVRSMSAETSRLDGTAPFRPGGLRSP